MQNICCIDVVNAMALLRAGAIMVDIRDEASFNAGHVTSALHLSAITVDHLCATVDPRANILVMCYHGISSKNAAAYLLHQGFTQVYSIDGGFAAWSVLYPESVTLVDPNRR